MKTNILRIIFLLFIVINSIIIFGFSSQNGEQSGNLSKSIIIKIADILNIRKNIDNFIDIGERIIRKIAHFAIYTSLGIWSISFLLTFNIRLKWKVVITTLWGITYSMTDEFHQKFSMGRHASIDDVVIDTLGIIFGILIVLFIIKLYEIIKNNKKIKSTKKSDM